jgi:hypothetical protein
MPRKPGTKGQGAHYGHPNGKVNKPHKDCAAPQLAQIWHLPAPSPRVRPHVFRRQSSGAGVQGNVSWPGASFTCTWRWVQ